MFAGVSLAIVWGAMAERTKLWVYFAFGVLFTLVYSVVSHWIWTPDGWLFAKGMQDFAGSTVVHYQGALAGLAGALLLGPRIGKYGPDGKPNAIPGHNMAYTTLGVIILWFGWFGFNPGSTLSVDFGGLGFFAYVALNTNIAAAAGVLGALVASWIVIKKPDLSMMLNGAIAALVAITAACAFVAPWAAIVIGFVAGVIVVFGVLARRAGRYRRPDRRGRGARHGGRLGNALARLPDAALAGRKPRDRARAGLFYGGGFHQLGVQALGLAAVGAFTFTASFADPLRAEEDVRDPRRAGGRGGGPRRLRARHVGLSRVLHPGSGRLRDREPRAPRAPSPGCRDGIARGKHLGCTGDRLRQVEKAGRGSVRRPPRARRKCPTPWRPRWRWRRASATAMATSPSAVRGDGGLSPAVDVRVERTVAHCTGDLLVRVAERDALRDERLGRVGGEEAWVSRLPRQPLLVELELARRARPARASAGARRGARRTTGRLSSWRSRLYASGRPFTIASSPVRRPIAVPAFPRASSATSGLSFCGIIDEPVAAASGRRTKPNSVVAQSTSSSPIRERWTNSTAQA